MNVEGGEVARARIERPRYSEEELGEVYGDYETINIPVDNIAILPQVRNRVNSAQSELAKSIQSVNLMNRASIVLMRPGQLSSHLDFINGVWSTDASIEEYGEPNNGYYPVLIAGHSRVNAIRAWQEESGDRKSVSCNIHNVSSSAEFLGLQLAENTYGGINPERRAFAIVEMYLYGHDKEAREEDPSKWSSYADFVRKNPGRLSEEILRDGMAFAALPPEARDYILSGLLYYGVGVEIGKSADLIKEYVAHGLGEMVDEKRLDQAYRDEVTIMMNNSVSIKYDQKGGLKRINEYIKGNIGAMRRVLNPPEQEIYQQTILDEMFMSPEIQAAEFEAQIAKNLRLSREKYMRLPINAVVGLIDCDMGLSREDLSEDRSRVIRAYNELAGSSVVRAAMEMKKKR